MTEWGRNSKEEYLVSAFTRWQGERRPHFSVADRGSRPTSAAARGYLVQLQGTDGDALLVRLVSGVTTGIYFPFLLHMVST